MDGSWCYIQIMTVSVFVNCNCPTVVLVASVWQALINNICVVCLSELDLLNGFLLDNAEDPDCWRNQFSYLSYHCRHLLLLHQEEKNPSPTNCWVGETCPRFLFCFILMICNNLYWAKGFSSLHLNWRNWKQILHLLGWSFQNCYIIISK